MSDTEKAERVGNVRVAILTFNDGDNLGDIRARINQAITQVNANTDKATLHDQDFVQLANRVETLETSIPLVGLTHIPDSVDVVEFLSGSDSGNYQSEPDAVNTPVDPVDNAAHLWFNYQLTKHNDTQRTVIAISNTGNMWSGAITGSGSNAVFTGWKLHIGSGGDVGYDSNGLIIKTPADSNQVVRITSENGWTYIQGGQFNHNLDALKFSSLNDGGLDKLDFIMTELPDGTIAMPTITTQLHKDVYLKFFGEFNKPDAAKGDILNLPGAPTVTTIPDDTDLKAYFSAASTGDYKSGWKVDNPPNGKQDSTAGWYNYRVFKHDDTNANVIAYDAHGNIYSLSKNQNTVGNWINLNATYAKLSGATFTDTIAAPQIEVGAATGETGVRVTGETGLVKFQPTDENGDATGVPITYDGEWKIDGKAISILPAAPTADGEYVLKVAAGVVSWVVKS